MPGRYRPSGGGPQTSRPGSGLLYRGSRKRLERITWYENTSIEFWIFVVLMLLALFLGVPWLVKQPIA
jgi:hypothetical protein